MDPNHSIVTCLQDIYAPTGNLHGTLTFKRMHILHFAFNETQQQHPGLHGDPSFAQAIAPPAKQVS